MRWNVVVGGQLFSKSLKGFTSYKLEFIGKEGLFISAIILLFPVLILTILLCILPAWDKKIQHNL